MSDTLLRSAFSSHQAGNLAEAMRLYGEVLKADPGQIDALCMLGLLRAQGGEKEEAGRLADAAMLSPSGSPSAFYNLGCLLQMLDRHDDALALYDKAIAAKPNYFEALVHRGISHFTLTAYPEALAAYDQALQLRPNEAGLWNNRGNVLMAQGRGDEAVESYDKAVALKPAFAEGWENRGNALMGLDRYEDADASYDKALSLRPNAPSLWTNRGLALLRLKRHADAIVAFDNALAADPRSAAALFQRGNALSESMRYEEALVCYEQASAIAPDFPYIRGNLAHHRLNGCDWRHLENDRLHIEAGLMTGKRVIQPFANIVMSHSMADQLSCARLWAMRELTVAADPLWRGEVYSHDRIRVAYLSADFDEHAGTFQHHDRSRFETIAVSYGPNDDSERLAKNFERLIDVRCQTDFEIAALLRQMEVDIAIDLKAYTDDGRPGILACRPAPVQVHYRGYPGTMGSDAIDYIIADKTVIPEKHRIYFREKIAYLPDTYRCSDSTHSIADARPTRADLGLPDSAFVFACFNDNFAIAPDIFAVWMGLLRENTRAVLWLPEYNAMAMNNLKREAKAAGIDSARLVFAAPRPRGEYRALAPLADLFLDTLPYNAQTTASDALCAGLPVLTVLGQTFAGRVGASLLYAAGLPELVTDSLESYGKLARRLSEDAAALAAIRARLARNRETCPLFDAERFTRNLEAAYGEMHARAGRGEPPETFEVSP